MNQLLQSSKDPKKLSRTVKGAAVTILGAVVSVAVAFGVDPTALPTDSQVTDIAKTVGEIAGAGSVIVGGVIHLYGVAAKVYNSLFSGKI